MVTASPYHPDGRVNNVPSWRLFLSKRLSALYRIVLPEKLFTYTSCFRVYRKSAMEGLELREGGFLGVAETLGLVALKGGRVAECPAVLEVRLLGRSKMKVLRTMAGHLRLLIRLGKARWLSSRSNRSVRQDASSPTSSAAEYRKLDRKSDVTREVR
jgi:dolichol-phosphate mannosyltransferase